MGAIMNGMALHGGVLPVRRHVPHLLRLHAAGDPPRGAHGPARDLRLHARLDRPRRGRPDAPADRAARGAARDPEPHADLRPADADETAEAWRVALAHRDGPVALVLTRQKLGYIDRAKYAPAAGVARGRATCWPTPRAARREVVLLSSGSEVALALAAREKLAARRHPRARREHAEPRAVRARRPQAYRDAVLPPGVPRASRSRRRIRCRGTAGSATDGVVARHRPLRRLGAVRADLRGARAHARSGRRAESSGSSAREWRTRWRHPPTPAPGC